MFSDPFASDRFTSVAAHDKHHQGNSGESATKDLVTEVATIGGVTRTIHRLYAKYESGFAGVGWIIDEDIDNCMVCNNEFGFFLRKHHCRSCGNIVCYNCSPDFVVIEEMRLEGPQRVCVQCYWGQYPVYASHTRTWESDEEDDNEDDDFLIASRINACINASVHAYHVQIFKYFEYSGEVVLEQGCDWKSLCECICKDLGVERDVQAGGGTEREQKVMFRHIVLVDGDGDDISPKITSSDMFWQFAATYSIVEKQCFMAYVDKTHVSNMNLARQGRQILEQKAYQYQQSTKGDSSLSSKESTTGAGENVDSDDSVVDEDVVQHGDDAEVANADAEKVTLNDKEVKEVGVDSHDIKAEGLSDPLDDHRQTVSDMMEASPSTLNPTRSRRSGSMYASSLPSSPSADMTLPAGSEKTPLSKKLSAKRRGSTGSRSSGISPQDAALLRLARRSLYRQVNDDDVQTLKDLPIEHSQADTARKELKYALSKEDEELLYLARHSLSGQQNASHVPFQPPPDVPVPTTDEPAPKPVISPEEALRMLMTLETRSGPSKLEKPTEKVSRLSTADEALLQLARHSIVPNEASSEELVSYLSQSASQEVEEGDEERLSFTQTETRSSTISLRDIHRSALFEAFMSIAYNPTSTSATSSESPEEVEEAYRVSKDVFLEWEQIQNVTSQDILPMDVVLREFDNVSCNEDNTYVDFEGFCTLMEQLELLAEERANGNSSSVTHPDTPGEFDIPDDIQIAYSSLIANDGVSEKSLLQWTQLRSAIDAGLLTEATVSDLFQLKLSNRSTSAPNKFLNELDMREFHELSLLLQRKIDEAAGEEEYPSSSVGTGPFSPLDYRHGTRNSDPAEHVAAGNGHGARRVSFKHEDSSVVDPPPVHGDAQKRARRSSSIDTIDTASSDAHGLSISGGHGQEGRGDSDEDEDYSLLSTVMTGVLSKQGAKVKNWKRRSFVLTGCRLSYYDGRKKLKGEFNTKGCVVAPLDPVEVQGHKEHAFIISGPGRCLYLHADSEAERDRWIEGLTLRIEEHERYVQAQQSTRTISEEPDESPLFRQLSSVDDGHTIEPETDSNTASIPSDNKSDCKWSEFLDEGESVICTGLVVKRNKYGMAQTRQLVLTARMALQEGQSNDALPRLFYVDPATMKVKGEVEWTQSHPPMAEVVNSTTFNVAIDSRTFRLTVPSGESTSADIWVTHINSIARYSNAK
mmetsp:Transcript_22937/g.33529  ORF Transcript_22937/g.33529 Transcript_22937/m.33529 type:complete len:1207 (+) Transcript_22937:65-3685(+)|eukprot:CAMPEP_0185035138 /NCGR_PEP_ID=MMETSP1103-20130426/25907_1 /TAXON_ID=36769 /ORGANISM="Paraphysomonas bandaiensis, Strain Caron Lab Isolate" /LENGTH=1206 /DNA_ID=CAMNT_0027572073 /DNA_START=55 /DNA_END=3675 /DNA_ORIENTATION=-